MAYPILAASSTWYKSSQARSTITQINVVDSYTPTGSENETWNADTGNTGSIKCYRTGTILTIAGNGSGKIAANTNSSYAFSDSSRTNFYSSLTVINGLNILDTSNVVNAEGMFSFFESLNTLDVGNFNTSNITNMTAMFARSPSLENLDVATKIINAGTEDEYIAWDVSNVSSFKAMFQGSSSTEKMKIKSLNVGDWNTSSATNMAHMFYRCGELTSIPLDNWNVSNVTTMSHMFSDCSKLQSINLINWDTSKVTTFDAMFNDCISLTTIDVSSLKTQSCLSFAQMFERCSSLTEIIGLDKLDTANGTNFDQMFEDCSNLTEIIGLNNWDTGSATDMHKMFRGCKSLTAIDVSSFIVNNPSAVSQMFEGCENVKYLDLSGFKTLGTTYLAHMFTGMNRLEKITLGSDFKFDGCDSSIISSAELPTPDPAYITGADGRWYDVNSNAIAPAAIPDKTFGVYYATPALVEDDANKLVLVKNGSLLRAAAAIRAKNGATSGYAPAEFADAILNI